MAHKSPITMLFPTTYESFAKHYERIAPIRGRAQDVRPIGERRKVNETIRKEGDAYHCRLYPTDCITYLPDRIEVRHGKHRSTTTAKFLSKYLPRGMGAFIMHGELWVRTTVQNESKVLPVPDAGLVFTYDGVPHNPMIRVKRVNRERAKAARATLDPFAKWARTMLRLSDGWIEYPRWAKTIPVRENVCNEDIWNEMLLMVCRNNIFRRVSADFSQEPNRIKFNPDYIYNRIIDEQKLMGIYDIVEIPASDKAPKSAVTDLY